MKAIIDEPWQYIERAKPYPPDVAQPLKRYFELQKLLDEVANFKIPAETLAQFQRIFIQSGRQMQTAFEKAARSWHFTAPSIDFNSAFPNRFMFGAEFHSREELERQALRKRRKEEREKCLHGQSSFPIRWAEGTDLHCPKCTRWSVWVLKNSIMCMLCGWSRPRGNGS